MKKLFVLAAAVVFVSAGLQARAEETWKGTISDSMCGMKHAHAKQGEKAADHRACIEKCVAGGDQYVLLTGDKVMKIANQSFAGLKTHAAHEVIVTGEIKNDEIVVSKIEMPKAEK